MSVFDNPDRPSLTQKYEWKCPRKGCIREIVSWTEKGLRLLIEAHQLDHESRDRENMKQFQAALTPIRDYNKLSLAWSDITFLKTRGIKIDADIQYDPTVPYFPYEGPGLSQKVWKRILEVCDERT